MRFYEYESKQILQTVGIPLPKSHFCTNAQEAKTAAETIGGPVVIKSQVLSGGGRVHGESATRGRAHTVTFGSERSRRA